MFNPETLKLWADFAGRLSQALNGTADAIDEAFDLNGEQADG